MKLDPYLIPHIKFNSKYIKDRSYKSSNYETLRESIGINFYDLGIDRQWILRIYTKAWSTKAKIDTLDFINIIKTLVLQMDSQENEKTAHGILNRISDNGLYIEDTYM